MTIFNKAVSQGYKGRGRVYVVGTDKLTSSMWFMNGFAVVNKQEDADIVCFIGGADIDPSLYGQKRNPRAGVYSYADYDRRDKNAWDHRKEGQILVGICRGGQFLNVMSGGSMIQDVDGHNGDHKVFDTVWNTETTVASSHHQMMVPGEDAEVFAYSEGISTYALGEEGDIPVPSVEPEVLYYEKTNSLCYQGHPEWSPKSGTDYFFKLLDFVMLGAK